MGQLVRKHKEARPLDALGWRASLWAFGWFRSAWCSRPDLRDHAAGPLAFLVGAVEVVVPAR